ncbi:MAG: hypothetical protein CMA72_09745 [Euryarchaeota archaeon]|nr:hypothetical protein [Euryarchaeota archaeon]
MIRKLVNEELDIMPKPRTTKLNESALRNVIMQEMSILREEMSDEEAVGALEDRLNFDQGVADVVAFLNSDEGNDPKVRKFIKGGLEDGDRSDEQMKVNPSATPTVGDMLPTQSEIGLPNSIGYPLSKFGSLKAAMAKSGDPTGRGKKIIASGNHVIDGHHRWSTRYAMAGPDATIDAVDIALPGSNADQKLAAAQIAIVATMDSDEKGVPKASAEGLVNILGKGKNDIKSALEKIYDSGQAMDTGEPILADDYMEQVMGDSGVKNHFSISDGDDADAARGKIIDVVADNLSKLRKDDSAPVRTLMPQFDGGQTHELDPEEVLKTAASGKVNYASDYGVSEAANRWSKMAGILRD